MAPGRSNCMMDNPSEKWQQTLALIKANVTEQQFKTWFEPVSFESYSPASKTLLVRVPSPFVYEYLEQNFIDLLGKALKRVFGPGVKLTYRVVTDQENQLSQDIEADPSDAIKQVARTRANQSPTTLDAAAPEEVPSNLKPQYNFDNYLEGESNKLCYNIGRRVAEHPNGTQFNPMFIFGPSGSGKTHLLNAIGLKTLELYPKKRVLYVSARLFQTQYTDAVLHNTTNDFINFYQTIDMLLIDDIQEWEGKTKTLNTFFHIFNHLFRNGKRILLACDRPPVELKDMPERLISRFAGGLVAQLDKPNVELCADIIRMKMRRDGLDIPEDVVQYVARTYNGSVREIEGAVMGLLAYSIVYGSNVTVKLAERIINRAVKTDNRPLTVDDIVETVCTHYNVTPAQVNSKSRRRDYVTARQVSMFFAQKYTKMPASRIGKLVGNRDHSTVIHSCEKVEQRMRVDKCFSEELVSIETAFRLKR